MKRRSTGRRRGRAIDFGELPTYVGYQVRRTQAKIFADFEATLASVDFTPGSFGVLTLIPRQSRHHAGGAGRRRSGSTSRP